MRPIAAALVLVFIAGGAARPSLAEPPSKSDQAQELYQTGMRLYAVEKYDDAIQKWEAGFVLDGKPEFLFNIARAQAKAKRPGEAVRFYRRYLELAPDAKDRADVEQEIARLQERRQRRRASGKHGGKGKDGAAPDDKS